MANASNESHDGNSSVGDTTPFPSPRSPPTDSESDLSDSPTDSLFSDGPYEPDLTGPPPDEEPQYRGRRSNPVIHVPRAPHPPGPPSPVPPPAAAPPPPPGPAQPHIHHGGANATVVQGVQLIAPFNHPNGAPNPPNHD